MGGPIALIGGNFFRIINGSEKDGFETDPVVKFLRTGEGQKAPYPSLQCSTLVYSSGVNMCAFCESEDLLHRFGVNMCVILIRPTEL